MKEVTGRVAVQREGIVNSSSYTKALSPSFSNVDSENYTHKRTCGGWGWGGEVAEGSRNQMRNVVKVL